MDPSRTDPRRLAAIYTGGVIGALLRVGLAEAVPPEPGAWPWATFAVNMAGALALGCLVAAMRAHRRESPAFALLTTGVCGTLTTFATLQLELFEMLEAGNLGLAIGYTAASLAGGLLLLRTGLSIGGGSFSVHGDEKEPSGVRK